MQIISIEDNLQEIVKSCFLGKWKKFNMSSAENFTQHAKC